MKTKLNKQCEWLLLWMFDRQPLLVSRMTEMPYDKPPRVSMLTLRGLERAGLVSEDKNYLFRLTEKGKLHAIELRAVKVAT